MQKQHKIREYLLNGICNNDSEDIMPLCSPPPSPLALHKRQSHNEINYEADDEDNVPPKLLLKHIKRHYPINKHRRY